MQLAFVAAIQKLPPRQRAALMLCDVLGWASAEAASLLDGSIASINSALQRARETLSHRYSGRRPPLESQPTSAQQKLLGCYLQAWERHDVDGFVAALKGDATAIMPPWLDELYALAEEHDGLLLSKEARALGITDSVLVRLARRGQLERITRGVYRIAHYPADRLAQYREAILWARANKGPEQVALSHETALLVYGISDVNPERVHLTVPLSARLRRERPKWIAIHRANLCAMEVQIHGGIPVTTAERSILDTLAGKQRTEMTQQANSDARRVGLITIAQAATFRKRIKGLVRS